MAVFVGLAGVVLGALVGALTTYFTTRSTMRIELEHSYDRALLDKRLERYQGLFHISKCIPRYWLSSEAPTRQDLHRFRQDFHDWYFGQGAGGMFLTAAAKDAYTRLLNMLAEAMREDGMGIQSSERSPLSPDESKALRELASELRHQLAEDVGAANPPRLRWARLGRTIQPPGTVNR